MNTLSTSTATLVLGKISSYSEWGPESPLRFVRRAVGPTMQNILQQRWTRCAYDTTGAICGGELEWRDVPLEIE